ncbi:hypothetical protein [Bradyrhizobium cenepequi]
MWNLKSPPDVVRRNTHRLGSRVIQRAAAQLANSFDPELIAVTIAASVTGPRLFAFQEKLAEAQHRAVDLLATYQLPHLPAHSELVARAKAMFAETPSLEDIVGLAQRLILDRISTRLSAAVQPA